MKLERIRKRSLKVYTFKKIKEVQENMKKLKAAAIFLAICSVGALVTGCGLFSDNGNSDGAPVYISDDRIDFTAYAPPTVMNWGGGTSNPNLITAEQYRYLAEAGFTKALALYEGRVGSSGLTANEKA